MITFRTNTYTIEGGEEQIFSKLSWGVEQVDNLWYETLNGATVESNRDWTGIVNQGSHYFRIMETGKIFNIKLFQVLLTGITAQSNGETTLKVKFAFGWLMLFWLIFTFIAGAIAISSIFIVKPYEPLIPNLLWTLVVVGLTIYLYVRKLNKLESKLEDLFDLK